MKKTLLILLGALALSSPAVFAQPARPNVIFILADDLGWSDTTLYGNTQFYRTPNIQRLAARGMLYTRAYSAGPLCSPTRASIMTGQSPARTGITSATCHFPEVILQAEVEPTGPANHKSLPCISVTRLKRSYYTLAEAMKAAGYVTGHFGKWHLGHEPYSPLEHGFDSDLPHTPDPSANGGYIAPWEFSVMPGFTPRTPNEHIEDRMADEAVAWMERHAGGRFFLNYWSFSVHSPFEAKPALVEKYRALVNPNDAQRSPTYAAMIETLDKAVGKLLNAVDRLGIANNTVIVFTSDNGGNMGLSVDDTTPTSNRPLRGRKGNIYEGGVRVPCVVSWPNRTPGGSVNNTVIQSSDFYPTFVDLLDLPTQPGQIFDGVSLAPTFAKQPLSRSGIFTFFPEGPQAPSPASGGLPPAVSITTSTWKLIRIFYHGNQGAHAYELYNLQTDIGETNNRAAARPDLVSTLDARIDQYLIDTQAVIPQPNPDYDPNTGP